MKLTILNLLRGGVFSLAVVAAFAFTAPLDPNQSMYGFYNGNWYDATGAIEDEDYDCSSTSTVCLYNQKVAHPDNAIPGISGTFSPITLTPED